MPKLKAEGTFLEKQLGSPEFTIDISEELEAIPKPTSSDPAEWQAYQDARNKRAAEIYREIQQAQQGEYEKKLVPAWTPAAGMMPGLFETPEQRKTQEPTFEMEQQQRFTPEQIQQALTGEGPGGITQPGIPEIGIAGTGAMQKALGGYKEELGVGKSLAEKQRKQTTEIFGKQLGALEQEQKVILEKEKGIADVYKERQQNWERLQGEQIKKEQYRQDYLNREYRKIQNAADTLAASKIDPYQFYKHPDGSANYPKSVASAIAIGLGALGASLPAQYGGTGGPNIALQIIDKAIERDIQAQRDDIANRRAGVGIQMNLLSQMRQNFDTERQAEEVTRYLMEKSALMKLDEVASANPDQRVQVQYEKLRIGLEGKMQETASNIDMNLHKEMLGGTEKIMGMEERVLSAKHRQAQLAMAKAGLAAKAIQTKGGKPLPQPAIAKMSDFRGAQGMIDQVRVAWNQHMKGDPFTIVAQYMPWATEAKKFNDLTMIAAQIIGKKFEGRMTDEDYKRFQAMLPAAGDSTERAIQKLDNVEQFLTRLEQEQLESYADAGYDISSIIEKRGKRQVTPGASRRE